MLQSYVKGRKTGLVIGLLVSLFSVYSTTTVAETQQATLSAEIDKTGEEKATDFLPGEHFIPLPKPVPTRDASKIEVVELFWYQCSHCFSADPGVEFWKMQVPEYVDFHRIPAVLGPSWRRDARLYYTAELLGILDRFHIAYFKEIHEKKRKIKTDEGLMSFFMRFGVTQDAFYQAFYSMELDQKLTKTDMLMRAYNVQGVPDFIVNGKYRVSASLPGFKGQPFSKIFDTIDFLAKKEKEDFDAARASQVK